MSASTARAVRRILAIVDASLERTPAVQKALALAQSLGAEMWLGLFDRGPHLGLIRLLDLGEAHRLEGILRDFESERLAEFTERLRQHHEGLVHVIDEPEPIDAASVAAAVTRHGIDVVFKDVGAGTTPWPHLFHSLDTDLLVGCPVPVWMVAAGSCALPARIAAAVDPVHPEHGAGPLDDAVVDWAATVAGAASSQLEVVSSFCDTPPGLLMTALARAEGAAGAMSVLDLLRARHAAQLDALLDRHGLPRSRARILEGEPGAALGAQLEADLIVVGVTPRHGWSRVGRGGTAERLLPDARCDVLAVPLARPSAPGGASRVES